MSLRELPIEVHHQKAISYDVVLRRTAALPSMRSMLEDDELFAKKLETLSPTHHLVLDLIARGYLNKQIAWHRGVSEATIKAHLSEILRRLDLKSRTQAAVKYAIFVERRRRLIAPQSAPAARTTTRVGGRG